MELIAHRINTKKELAALPERYGVELDLRDGLDGRVYMQHDPFTPGEDFEEYLKAYRHGTMILNVKSERVEYKVLELMEQYKIGRYFFLDSTFPMIKALSDRGVKSVALRYSELEGMDTLEAMRGRVDWVWADCFTRFPLDAESYGRIKAMGYKVCIVSPELEGQPEKIKAYRAIMEREGICPDAVCTKQRFFRKWDDMLQRRKW